MDSLIDWDISEKYIEFIAKRREKFKQSQTQYYYHLSDEEEHIVCAYFTNVWLHTNEHTEPKNSRPFPSLSYDNMTIQISIGKYEVKLTCHVEQDDFVCAGFLIPSWTADVEDKKSGDLLDIFVQSHDYDVLSYASSIKSEKFASVFVDEIYRRCHHEFGFQFINE